ncbi:tRNA (adenosine(37)-N6)-threonylcarbamoyltransferase complex transferase subunit TsaD [Halanaerobiaceae bacterium Z-7014]|uniref:tRNA N6-adenosine threonylcarbamoyltransferase n=1 Tax=Halonatronomonas betaini TaxID=2778430 RepID=A0A931AXY8_9FIRM|nr:tRNA (adenosine(37)-N6)-threonylcarbamoyltransferase complex transferase subunit TsaD [Halonatronomonas betaini]MBF8438076.1 tRNA (adenosine(37)-N6)-threonylcarbamoyltransferase complex transferase subunit TsaD [Halonatronomonas betaini]
MDDKLILAVETSCDETSAAVIGAGPRILSNIVASQVDWHKKFGGVVPEIASRKHLELIEPVIDEAISEAGIEYKDLDAVAATRGPGLVGALLVGFAAAKGLAYSLGLPFIGVNHVAGHIYANFLINNEIASPFICLTVSGGHTDLLYFDRPGSYRFLGRTRDDAAGEAFDKIARFLELGYPGGPEIEKMAKTGDANAIELPRALVGEEGYDFSFSGLKTAVINYVHNASQRGEDVNKNDLAASFQQAVVDSLTARLEKAVMDFKAESILLAGGVAANQVLRNKVELIAKSADLEYYVPPLNLCTDNAAMIGAAAYYRYADADFDNLDIGVKADLSM